MSEQPQRMMDGIHQELRKEYQAATASKDKTGPQTEKLMEEILRRENLIIALKRVQSNKGAPGVDGMSVEELPVYLKENWPRIREELLNAVYVPLPVRSKDIAKPGGGTRMLGIPTVLDRFIGQAILQVLIPIVDSDFRNSAMAFGLGEARLTQWHKRNSTSGRDIDGWWILTWRSSLTGSTTTF